MAKGAAKFVLAVIASIIAAAPIASRAQNAIDFPPEAPPPPEKTEKPADDCLAAPGGETPSGQRWAYRLERGTRLTEGVNTRLFRKIKGKWLITMNHVSAYDVTSTPTAPEAR